MQISEQILNMKDDCVKIRRELHRIPEIGFDLHKTHEYIRPLIEQCKPDELITIAETGFKVVFYAQGAQRTIAFRADMDGMKNTEENRFRFRSRNRGVMHGCGHDGHMTILLMLAKWVSQNRDKLKCNVVLLFQPGEEGWAGARRMINEGALVNPKVDRIYGLHLWPTVPKGKIGIRWENLMAQTSDFVIKIHGKSAHASTPQMGVDAIVVAAELITMIQSVITRDVDPHQDALLTLGKINGGTAHNVIAEEVTMSGTLRVFSNELYDRLMTQIISLLKGLELATGAGISMETVVHYPYVANPREMVEKFYTVLDSMDDVVLVEPVMAAEDFAEYQQEVDGMFMFLGINGGRGGAPLHSSRFDFDEDALLVGAEAFKRILECENYA